MSTFDDFKQGLAQAWGAVAEGWRDFTERAGDALTRFNPVSGGAVESPGDRIQAAGSRWGVLAADVTVDDDAVEVCLELPGMEADGIGIDVRGDLLVVSGEKRAESSRREGRFHVMERAYGRFERALRLPVAVDENEASANYERGVLRIRLPRAAHTRVRKITVKAA